MAHDNAYHQAEDKIEEARRAGAKVLTLRSKWPVKDDEKLTELPESIGQLGQLESLDLSGNKLTALPESIRQLAKLQSLNLSKNQLTVLPESIGEFTRLQSLNLSENQLTALPESIRECAQLRSLYLSLNQLDALPEWINQFRYLQILDLCALRLTAVPEWIGQLTQLQSLDLHKNKLRVLGNSMRHLKHLRRLNLFSNELQSLPDWIGEFGELEDFGCGNNPLKSLPDSLGDCTKLTKLDLGDYAGGLALSEVPTCIKRLRKLREFLAYYCNLESLPGWLADLDRIETIDVKSNHIRSVPLSFTRLVRLVRLGLEDNPLNPELAAAYKNGLPAVKTYLRELAKGSRRRYEAKLLILGDGNEGKTCISRALRGLPFKPQVTTRGVDVEQWTFEHPDHLGDKEKTIILNIWDFEGQEINHQTHQFFLTTQSLYILVFKCRDQFLMDRAEYWLDTIRARAPKAKVAIVITQSEERTPYVPQDKLRAQYGDLLAEGQWLFAVGCANNSGIPDLQKSLKRWAADLEFMGCEWPESYGKAEMAIKDKARGGIPNIGREEVYEIFRQYGIEKGSFSDVAASMARLGVVTQFPDCPDLRNFIVLQPQWLTKAISEIMEDKQLATDKGDVALRRMENIWNEKGYPGLFSTFHNCMKEFELCYDLEDASRSCLVPLRFGYEKPQIPWSIGHSVKERRVEYKLNIRTPIGLMSRFIVKTHHMIVKTPEYPKGVYWHNGVFLRTGTGSFTSEALCEFDSDERKLRIQVRAAFPQNLIEQIHAYVKAVFSFFSGLEPERSYGCIKIDDQTNGEETCKGVHTESRIYSAIYKQRDLDCEYEFHDVDPQKLVWGFSSFGEYMLTKVVSIDKLRQELDKRPEWAEGLTRDIVILLGWVEQNHSKIEQLLIGQGNLSAEIKQEAELKLHEYLAYVGQMLDERDLASAPAIFSINTKDRSKWNPKSYFKQTYVLTPFCECDQNIHPTEDGRVEFNQNQDWWNKTAPWIGRGTKVLSAGLQLAFAGMPLTMGAKAFDAIKEDVDFMKELAKYITAKPDASNSEETRAIAEFESNLSGALVSDDPETRLIRAALSRMLEAIAPVNYRARQWGSLSRVRMSDNSYRWLCSDCAARQKS